MTQHPWRRGGIFDAIVAVPPYGIRAGAKRLGRRNLARQRDEPYQMADGSLSHELSDYISPTRPYHLLDLTRDLLDFTTCFHTTPPPGSPLLLRKQPHRVSVRLATRTD
ncbi:hypothetical protein CF328_g6187 [Tilletia controversa]|nr:hypothetical protein CF328_g6187 [Tilletia controversa]